MKNILVVGAGKIGSVVADLLARTPGGARYDVTLADAASASLAGLAPDGPVRPLVLEVADSGGLRAALAGRFAVVSALPFHSTLRVAEAARAAGVHYFDLTEDVASTRRIRALAEGAATVFVPQCGLAPGFVSIVAADLARSFDTLDTLRLRVGALPAYPSNALNYNLTWSTEGVINEYIEPCEAIVEGRLTQVAALEELEEFALDGVRYEAFNTSGGLGTLAATFEGRVRTMNYRTIRYPGHAAIMKALLRDLRLADRRDLLKDILERALPATLQDVVIVFVTASGWRDGRLLQDTWARKIYSRRVFGKLRSAIQVTTACSVCALVDLLAESCAADRGSAAPLPTAGFVRHEDLDLAAFLGNRFGRVYAAEPLARAA